MSNIKISEMAEAESLNDNDLLTIVQDGINKKITKQNAIGDIIQAINNPTYTITEGTDLSIDNTRVGKIKFEYYGNTSQNGTPTPNNPVEVKTVTGENNINITSGNFLDSTTWTNDKYINSSNEIADATSWRYSDYVDISEGGFFYQNGVTGNLPKTILYDANKNPIQVLPVNFTLYDLSIYNAKYIRISTTTGVTPQLYKSQNYEINLASKNLFDKDSPNILNAYLNANGTTTENSTFRVSDYINVSGLSNITISGNNGNSEMCCFYNENKIFISSFGMGTLTTKTVSVPNNAKYLRVTINVAVLNQYQIEKGSTASPYKSFWQIELCDIEGHQDYIYTNGGKWYLRKENGKVDLATLSWATQIYLDDGYKLFFATINDIKYASNSTTLIDNYSEKYIKSIASGMSQTNKRNHLAIDTDAIRVNATDYPTGLFYYPLATPTDTEITNTALINQLNAIKYGAESYYGQTNIMITSADLKLILKVQTLDKIGD